MEHLTTLQLFSIWILPVLFAITVHEAAHGWVAFKLGDKTAYRLGRITLNPIKHIDLVGTILMPLFLFFFTQLITGTPFIFGWAKPVPVNFSLLHHPRRDMGLVALAGPASNFLMAIFWIIMAKIGFSLEMESAIFLLYMGIAGIFVNTILMVINLFPILPLDGGRILHSLLPPQFAQPYSRSESFGLPILIILLVTGLLETIITPVILFISNHLSLLV